VLEVVHQDHAFAVLLENLADRDASNPYTAASAAASTASGAASAGPVRPAASTAAAGSVHCTASAAAAVATPVSTATGQL